ncbi:unnamed protein product [Spirodela intermedia]|uniref:NAC domain-containing protein n=1 Tax=Spirodela intermedia TaxID=51605 RepID=A0A7I8IEN2_SPIIN|nr:unnamed protein product [Spirodela intermedia]CAA6656081.1 unnamed protein product [Spirodela intermedia]
MNLPGFRFHPTEEELLDYYLKGAIQGKKLGKEIIATGNIYRHDPWDLPRLARTGEREWYFFVPRDKLSSNGGKPKRTTERGFWKATGSDRPIRSVSDPSRLIGLKKTLVFYEGRAPRGIKTDWIMNEYRLPDTISSPHLPKVGTSCCAIYRKAKSMKELEKRVAPEGKSRPAPCVTSGAETSYSASATSSSDRDISVQAPPVLPLLESEGSKKETKVEMEAEVNSVPRVSDPTGGAYQIPCRSRDAAGASKVELRLDGGCLFNAHSVARRHFPLLREYLQLLTFLWIGQYARRLTRLEHSPLSQSLEDLAI